MRSTIPEIEVSMRDRVAVVTLNRPGKLNAVTRRMSAELATVVGDCNDSDEVRAVVLTGAGERAFCVGSDIGELDDYDTLWSFRNRADYCDAFRRLRKPVVAAVNGYAFGGGLELALTCDIRVAAANATFAAPEVTLGWIGGGGMAGLLHHAIGTSNAAFLLMTGEPVDADTALRWSLVSEVTTPDSLAGRAVDIATTIASRAPLATEAAKRNLHAAANLPREQALAYERELQAVCFATADAAEGRAAFTEKRPPRFTGR